jgi:hypothetical protein
LRIANDGAVRVCPGQGASDTCTNGITGRVTVDPDQTTYPGALVLELGGQRIGRAVVGKRSDGAAISVDVYSAAAGGSFTSGNWTLQPAAMAPVAATALDGEWLCTHPEQGGTGRSMRHYVSIGNGLLQTDTIDIDLKLSANAASGTGARPMACSAANGPAATARARCCRSRPTASTTQAAAALQIPTPAHWARASGCPSRQCCPSTWTRAQPAPTRS